MSGVTCLLLLCIRMVDESGSPTSRMVERRNVHVTAYGIRSGIWDYGSVQMLHIGIHTLNFKCGKQVAC